MALRTVRPGLQTGLFLTLAVFGLLPARPLMAGPPPLERVGVIALKGPVGGMDHLAVDAKRGRLFVANTANDSPNTTCQFNPLG